MQEERGKSAVTERPNRLLLEGHLRHDAGRTYCLYLDSGLARNW